MEVHDEDKESAVDMPDSRQGNRQDAQEDTSVSDIASDIGSVATTEIHGNTAYKEPISPPTRNTTAAARFLRSRKEHRSRTKVTVVHSPKTGDKKPPAASTSPSMKGIALASESPSSSNDPSKKGFALARRNFRKRAALRNRVAGGAAAKLMLQGPSPKEEDELDEEDAHEIDKVASTDSGEVSAGSDELNQSREKAKEEFNLGSELNTRYKPPLAKKDEEKSEALSEASLPSILNRSEIFHENATSAILSLLTKRTKGGDDNASVVSSSTANMNNSSPRVVSSMPRTSAFQTPERGDVISVMSGTSPRSMVDTSFEAMPRSPNKPMLPVVVEQQIEDLKTNMLDPSKTTAELLTAIASPTDDMPMDRGYMVRRKNACGALKVLTANPANRVTLCYTVGVLPALTAVLADTGDEGLEVAFPDSLVRREYIEARKRAVASLLHLSTPKENRIPVFHSDGLLQAVTSVIADDKGESRQGCCAVLAYLAKTVENRLLLVQVPGLLDAINGVIKPKSASEAKKANARKFVWDSPTSGEGSESYFNSKSFTPTNTDNSFETGSPTDTGGTGTDGSTLDESDSDTTPVASPTSVASKVAAIYDKDPNKFLHGARQFAFATLLLALKEKDNSYQLARHKELVETLVEISYLHESPSHTLALKVIAHLTRHRGNSKLLSYKYRIVVPCLVHATNSHDLAARQHACFSLQNLSQDTSCRQEVASTKNLLEAMCSRARHAVDQEEKQAAVSCLKNLADEPSNLIPMTNTPECFATLMHVANGDQHTNEMMQYIACDALSTLSHWLRKIATSGYDVDAKKEGLPSEQGMLVPSFKVVTWSQWS